MSTFYVLPPRSILGDRLVDSLSSFMPGIAWDADGRQRLAETVLEALANQDEVYLVPRDELPTGVATETALIDGYGASAGDEVIEVRPAGRSGEFSSRRWRISCIGSSASA